MPRFDDTSSERTPLREMSNASGAGVLVGLVVLPAVALGASATAGLVILTVLAVVLAVIAVRRRRRDKAEG